MCPSVPHSTGDRNRAEHLGPDRRRPQVLDTALEITATEGLSQVTMGAIATRLGVSRPVVYACYPGRGELLSALLDRETTVLLSRLMAILPPLKTSSVEQMFVDGFRSLLGEVRARPASWRIIFADDPDPIISKAVARGRTEIAEQTSAVMRPLFERWGVPKMNRTAPVLSTLFLGMCETAVQMMLDPDADWQPDELADVVGRASYRALRAIG